MSWRSIVPNNRVNNTIGTPRSCRESGRAAETNKSHAQTHQSPKESGTIFCKTPTLGWHLIKHLPGVMSAVGKKAEGTWLRKDPGWTTVYSKAGMRVGGLRTSEDAWAVA